MATDTRTRRWPAELPPWTVLAPLIGGMVLAAAVLGFGSGGPFATAAATALLHHTKLGARQVVEEAMSIAGKICIYTNENVSYEELG